MRPANEVVFVDTTVPDLLTLLTGLRPGVEAIVLDPARPAARQMAEALSQRRGLGAVHVVAHGAPGRISFAGGDWTAAAVAEQADDLGAVGRALVGGGALCLWSCEAGLGADGQVLASAVRAAAASPVALAQGLVGAEALGGTWGLSGDVVAQAPLTGEAQVTYAGVVGQTPGPLTWTGASGTSWGNSKDWNWNGGPLPTL